MVAEIRGLFLSAALAVSPATAATPENLVRVTDTNESAVTLDGMSYDVARLHIMAAGWEPVKHVDPDTLVMATQDFYDRGFTEVDTCSPVGNVPCNFDFEKDGWLLRVHTLGEEPVVSGYDIQNTNPRADFSSTPLQNPPISTPFSR